MAMKSLPKFVTLLYPAPGGGPYYSCVISRPHHALAKKPVIGVEMSSFEVIPVVKRRWTGEESLYCQQSVLFLLCFNLHMHSHDCKSLFFK